MILLQLVRSLIGMDYDIIIFNYNPFRDFQWSMVEFSKILLKKKGFPKF